MSIPPLHGFSEEETRERILWVRRAIEVITTRYKEQAIEPEDFGKKQGPFHAASILSWCRIAELAGVPYIPVIELGRFSNEEAWSMADGEPSTNSSLGAIEEYLVAGGFWRTDLCASEEVKYLLSEGLPLSDVLSFGFDDSRIMELNTYMPEIKIVGRPRITPYIVNDNPQENNDYPVEFRVFIGGKADSVGAVSFYYPQAPVFRVTRTLERAMELAKEHAYNIHEKRLELGLTPWLPQLGDPGEYIGCTIDFMLDQQGMVLMVDAGPGFGYGAHPCCFIDDEVKGTRWAPKPGVKIR